MFYFINVNYLTDKITDDHVKVVSGTVMRLQEFVQSMQRLQADSTEYAYLKVICLFSPGRSPEGQS